MFCGRVLLCKPGIAFWIEWRCHLQSPIPSGKSDWKMAELRNFVFRQGHCLDAGRRRVDEDDSAADFFDQFVFERDVAPDASAVDDAFGIQASGTDRPGANGARSAQGFQLVSAANQHAIEKAVAEVADTFRQHESGTRGSLRAARKRLLGHFNTDAAGNLCGSVERIIRLLQCFSI